MAAITLTLSQAKSRAKRAHQTARAGDTVSAAVYDRWLANTLSAAAGQDQAVAAAMFTRLAIALEVMVDCGHSDFPSRCLPARVPIFGRSSR